MPWCVYLLRCADGTLYAGATNDLERRVAAHHAGRGAKYLRGRCPAVPVWVKQVRGRGAALKLEARVKKMKRSAKEALFSRG